MNGSMAPKPSSLASFEAFWAVFCPDLVQTFAVHVGGGGHSRISEHITHVTPLRVDLLLIYPQQMMIARLSVNSQQLRGERTFARNTCEKSAFGDECLQVFLSVLGQVVCQEQLGRVIHYTAKPILVSKESMLCSD